MSVCSTYHDLEVLKAFDLSPLSEADRQHVQDHTVAICQLGRRAAQDIIEIGERLEKIKHLLPHGHWLPWLETVGMPERSARRFMQVADTFKSANLTDLNIGVSALYQLASASEEIREAALARAQQGEAITHTTVKELVREAEDTGAHLPEELEETGPSGPVTLDAEFEQVPSSEESRPCDQPQEQQTAGDVSCKQKPAPKAKYRKPTVGKTVFEDMDRDDIALRSLQLDWKNTTPQVRDQFMTWAEERHAIHRYEQQLLACTLPIATGERQELTADLELIYSPDESRPTPAQWLAEQLIRYLLTLNQTYTDISLPLVREALALTLPLYRQELEHVEK